MEGVAIYAIVLLVIAVAVFLFARRTTPKRPSDAQAIEQLVRTGANLTRPHRIEFRFFFPTAKFAERVSSTLTADGFQVSTQEMVQGHQYIVRATRSMLPALSELESLRSRFDELANREGGLYEGWSAEGVK